MNSQKPTTIGILGGEAVVISALELLLESVGYDTKLLEEASAGNAGEQLEGVDVLLLLTAEHLSEEHEEDFLGAMRADSSAAAHVPVLTLSTALKEALPDRTGLVPWPSRLEDLQRAIEATI
jgi:hypothetical protein